MILDWNVQSLCWVTVATLFALLAFFAIPWLSDYIRKWKIMSPIPGPSPTYPLLGNALELKPNSRGHAGYNLIITYYYNRTPCTKRVLTHLYLATDEMLDESDKRKRSNLPLTDLFLQMIEFTETLIQERMIKLWIGPVPFLVLYNAETVEAQKWAKTDTKDLRPFSVLPAKTQTEGVEALIVSTSKSVMDVKPEDGSCSRPETRRDI